MSDHSWISSYDEGVKWDMPLEAAPVYDMLRRTAAYYGHCPGFDFLGYKLTWAEIEDFASFFAAGLQAQGIGKGSHVGLFLPNCPYYIIAYYAVLKTGATLVNFNPLYPPPELEFQINDSKTTLMITLDLKQLFDPLEPLLETTCLERILVCPFTRFLPFPKNVLFGALKRKDLSAITPGPYILKWDNVLDEGARHEWQDVVINPEEDIALLQYTGGTTGTPKGAMLTHHNITANAQQCAAWFPDLQYGKQKMLGVLPFFHVFAMTAVMNLSVVGGLEIVALPRFDLEQTLKLIQKSKPHIFPGVPAIYNAIFNCPHARKYDLSSLQYGISGGAPLPVQVKANFEKLSGCTIVEGYGLTESSPVVCVNPLKGDNIAGSIGLPVPGTEVVIIDPDSGKAVSTGERGELCARGPQVMKGYWNREEETAGTFRKDLLRTGDIAIMDERGYVYIVDRIKDMIITNGYNVYPRNVEEAIYKHEAVEECIVAGLPHEQRGEIVKAWIKCKEGKYVLAEDLKTFLKDLISPMEIPREIEFRSDPLPKTLIGKLSRKDILAEELGD